MVKRGLTLFLVIPLLIGIIFSSSDALTGLSIVQAKDNSNSGQWIGAWSASPMAPHDGGISNEGFDSQTIRMIVHPNASGKQISLRFSNTFGTEPLTFHKVTVADTEEGAKMKPDTNKTLTFDQEQSVTIPPGEEIHSDPIPYQVTDGEDLTVSVNVSSETGPATWHWFSYQTTYISKEGDYTESNDEEAFSETVNSWFWLSGVDVKTESNKKSRVIVALGDSITDGYMSTVNANHRWTDFLNERLDEEISNQTFSVLNQGITGNRILADSPIFGEKALSRLDRDVFSQTGVTDVILYEGINDVGHQPHVFDADKIIFGMKEIASKAHDRGLRIYAATLTPFNAFTDDSNYYTDEGEATRQEVNKWIRNNDVFDGFFDFDKAIVDPSSPDKILPEYDSGDHLHPNDRGLEKLADSIDLSMFEKPLNRGKAFVN